MDTITNIINSVPEPLATAILTATFTGIIIFVLQKRIEHSFAENLEKLRSNLQYSNFEQQTKFAQIHAKRVETLETLYQKLAVIYDKFNRKLCNRGLENLEFAVADDIESDLFNDFSTYFQTNRLFLTTDSIFEIQDIYTNISVILNLVQLLRMYFDLIDFSALTPVDFHYLSNEFGRLGLEVGKIKNKSDLLMLFELVQNAMRGETEKLENLYKSIADIRYEDR